MANSAVIVHVSVRVKPESIEAFRAATLLNARASIAEAGVTRFDVLQDPAVPTHFLFVEHFRSLDAQQAHRETAHYQSWRDTVAEMMAEPRSAHRYEPAFPDAI